MAESRRPTRKTNRPTASKTPTERPQVREEKQKLGAIVKPTDVAALAKSLASVKVRLAESEAKLAREKQERTAEADTIAEMLVRIVGLEKALKVAAANDQRRRSMGPPVAAVDTEARARLASFELRVTDAEARARNAESRTAEAHSQARAAQERLATVVRDYEAARNAAAEADARARSAEDRTAHAEHLAQSAKARATEVTDRFVSMQSELITFEARARAAEARPSAPIGDDSLARELGSVRIQLEAAHLARDGAAKAIAEERENHQRELEQQRERNARALREAHDAYSEAFAETLEDERRSMREELDDQRARVREAHAQIAELEDRVRTADDRNEAALSELRRELETLAFDRDAADGQRQLTKIQLRAAEAKIQLVDRQLEWAEESVSVVNTALARLGADDELGAAAELLVERLGSARAALFTVSDDPPPKPPPLPGKKP